VLVLNADIAIDNRKIKTILQDAEKSAAAANLVYMNDRLAGITRIKKRNGFMYRRGNATITDKNILLRIKKLVIPPAWKKVWICPLENGHLQATGLDARKRKQYKYHALWSSLRNHTKFYRLHALGTVMPRVRQQIEKDLSRPGLPQQKVLAAVVSLMEHTSMRVGNTMYEKLYGSFGITTLKDQHVTIKGSNLRFAFKGKKGVSQSIGLNNKRLAAIVKQCRDIPGKELFQYYDENGQRHSIDSGMVNEYLKTISGGDFTAKDFRTWAGTVHALVAFGEMGPCDTATGIKKNIIAVLDQVASYLGNTRSVCKKYYVHPVLVHLYENKALHRYFSGSGLPGPGNEKTGLSKEEQLLMRILEKEGLTVKL
jgi:DNA topoisomerase-1